MAIIKTKDRSITLPDGSEIREACEELGVSFGCRSGICGTCKINIIEGKENLFPLTFEEVDMGDRDQKHRLACQAKIIKGSVTIKFE